MRLFLTSTLGRKGSDHEYPVPKMIMSTSTTKVPSMKWTVRLPSDEST